MTFYNIEGITCQGCVQKITKALSEIDGVEISMNAPHLSIPDDIHVGMMELQHKLSTAGNYILYPYREDEEHGQHHNNNGDHDTDTPSITDGFSIQGWVKTYKPILLIVGYISIASFVGSPDLHGWMYHFMAGFFLVFSFFKFLDIRGFADAYATYDVLAAKWHTYGYIYPFLELLLGLAFLFQIAIVPALIFSIILMGFGCIGVLKALQKGTEIRCACLGTTLNLPMSTITLVENLSMVAMSSYMLLGMLA